MIKTKYPLFKHGFLLGYDPCDYWVLNLPYHEGFTRENWPEVPELLAKNRVNGSRFFLLGTESKKHLHDFYIPYQREPGGRFDLTKFGVGMEEIEWKLEKFWERDIATMICIATGINGRGFKHTVWHGQNNINDTTDDHRRFMGHAETERVYRKVIKNLWLRWKDKPIIFEFINEPLAFRTEQLYQWYRRMMDYCISLGIPTNQFAFEKWDSGRCEDLLKEYNCWMFCHTMNSLDHMKRIHKHSMQREYFKPFDYVASNSDGVCESFPGSGLVGLPWNPTLKKPAPQHMRKMFIHDKRKSGAGGFWGSASAYVKSLTNDKPIFVDWKHGAIDGYTKAECKYYGVDWRLFSYWKWFKRHPLGELKAIRKASNRIF